MRTFHLPDVHEIFLRGKLIDRGQDGGRVVAETLEFLRREGEDALQELNLTAVVKLEVYMLGRAHHSCSLGGRLA